MKRATLYVALGLAPFGANAQEVVGNVVATTPVIQQVAVPRQNCIPGQPVAQPQTSGLGGLMGAIAGGALGSTIGHGTGTAAAVLLGTVGGAILGNQVEGGGQPAHAAPTCTTETTYENRTVAYNVTYEYGGQRYTVQMPYDPGPTIRLHLSPVSQGVMPPAPLTGGAVTAPPVQSAATPLVAPAPAPVAPMVMPAPVVVAPYAVYPAPYPPPVYYRPYPYPPVGVSIGFVFGNHRHRGSYRHRHWR